MSVPTYNQNNQLVMPISSTDNTSIAMPASKECEKCGNAIKPTWSSYRKRFQINECPCVTYDRYVTEVYQTWLSLSGIPVKYANNFISQFDATSNSRALQAAKAFLDHHYNFCLRPKLEGMSLFLQGPQGTGKTLLASGIAMELFQRAKVLLDEERHDDADQIASLAWVSGTTLYHQAFGDDTAIPRGTLGKSTKLDTWKQQLSHYKSVKLLILDDLGKEPVKSGNNFVGSYLFDIIEARYNNNLSTIVTCNQAITSIPDSYLMPILDRFKETGYYVELSGASNRKPKFPPLAS